MNRGTSVTIAIADIGPSTIARHPSVGIPATSVRMMTSAYGSALFVINRPSLSEMEGEMQGLIGI